MIKVKVSKHEDACSQKEYLVEICFCFLKLEAWLKGRWLYVRLIFVIFQVKCLNFWMDFPEFGSGFAPLRMNCTNFGYLSAFLLTIMVKSSFNDIPFSFTLWKVKYEKSDGLKIQAVTLRRHSQVNNDAS